MNNPETNPFRLVIKILWAVIFSGIIIVIAIFFRAAMGYYGPMPDLQQLENPKTNLATQIFSSDGAVLGKYYYEDNRTPIQFDELPENIINGLVATEDERFYSHSGIDWRRTISAFLFLGKRGGASTITQQLARQLFVGVRSRNISEAVIQKVKEWVLSVQLERRYTKKEIIAMYLNIYDFGYNADGIRSASKIFFNTTPKNLKIEQSATLIVMLKNSSYYNPLRRPELVKKRRNIVFKQMERNGYLTPKAADSLSQTTLEIDYTPESHREGLATYFRAYLQDFMRKWIKENPKENGKRYNLYRDGLKIYTTIDSQLQSIGEESVRSHMKNLQKEFFRQNTKELNETAPFLDLRTGQIDTLLERTAYRSERWRNKTNAGWEKDEILKNFQKPVPMTVFTWEGERDTVMTPLDSLRYYKYFLRSSMMSMEPQTGHVKVWVGGYDYKHFQYDQVKQGRRQIGSTFKPFLYATAIDQLKLSPCDILPDALFCIEPNKHGNIDAWCPKN